MNLMNALNNGMPVVKTEGASTDAQLIAKAILALAEQIELLRFELQDDQSSIPQSKSRSPR